jgi:hypothetical protein
LNNIDISVYRSIPIIFVVVVVVCLLMEAQGVVQKNKDITGLPANAPSLDRLLQNPDASHHHQGIDTGGF